MECVPVESVQAQKQLSNRGARCRVAPPVVRQALQCSRCRRRATSHPHGAQRQWPRLVGVRHESCRRVLRVRLGLLRALRCRHIHPVRWRVGCAPFERVPATDRAALSQEQKALDAKSCAVGSASPSSFVASRLSVRRSRSHDRAIPRRRAVANSPPSRSRPKLHQEACRCRGRRDRCVAA